MAGTLVSSGQEGVWSLLYKFAPYSLILLFTTGMALTVAAVIRGRRTAPGAKYLFFLELGAAVWAFSALFEMAATTVPLKVLWSQISYLGIATAPGLFFLFAATYTHADKRLMRRTILLLGIVPILTFVVILSDRLRIWHWSDVIINPQTNIAVYEHGPWFWVFVAYQYVLLATGVFLLIRAMVHFPSYYRSQMGAVVLGAVLPIVGNAIYVSGLNPIPGVDWTPLTFALTGIVLAWAVFSQQMFTLVPVARDRLIEGMPDSVLVLDTRNRIVDINPAAQSIWGLSPKEVIGKPVTEGLRGLDGMESFFQAVEESRTETQFGDAESRRYFDWRLSPLMDRQGRITGRLLVMRDITRRRQMEDEREELVSGLRDALSQVRALSGLLPICANCKKIRDDQGYWHSVEKYIHDHADVNFSHSICPDCMKVLYPEYLDDQEQAP
jgi:PAS domain S-box-containing protein